MQAVLVNLLALLHHLILWEEVVQGWMKNCVLGGAGDDIFYFVDLWIRADSSRLHELHEVQES
jgi:hypothetical protein